MKSSIPILLLVLLSGTWLPSAVRAGDAADKAAALPQGSVSLAEAFALVLERHPSLQIYEFDRRAAEARVLSALERPNPELETEIEDVLGSGDFRGFDSAVYNVGVSQLIELGGKRRLRGEMARYRVSETELSYEAQKRAVLAETAVRFVDVLETQRAEADARATEDIAKEALDNVSRQQDEGRASSLDVAQSEIAVEEAKVALENARLQGELARQRLASLWNEEATFDSAQGELLPPAAAAPMLEDLKLACEEHPRLRLAEAELSTARSGLELEVAKRTPDVTAGLAFRHDSPSDDGALVLAVSVPLPLWNRNEGGIAEAEAVRDRQAASVGLARRELEMAVVSAYAELRAARAEYASVTGKLIQAAESAYDSTLEGHRLGRFTYLELLEARRELVSLRARKTTALGKYHRARVTLESLTGRDLSEINS